MSVLVLKYSFESNEIDGLTINNSSYGARSLTATFSAQNMTSSNTYIVGGQSAYFSGSSFINLPDISNLSSSITISLWAYISTSRSQRLLELRNATQRFFISYDISNNILFALNNSRYIFTNTSLSPNNWHHIAWVIAPNIWYVYVNNNKNVINQSTNFTGAFSGALSFLGKGGTDNAFSGYADDFRIYSGALSDDQIYEIYDKGTYSEYFRFESEDVVLLENGTRVIANLASGMPVYDASIVSVSSPTLTYGTSAFNVVNNVYKSGNASIYSNGTAGNYVSISPITNINPDGITISIWYYAETNSGQQTICSLGTNSYHWVVSYNGTNNYIACTLYGGSSSPLTSLGEMRTNSLYPNGNWLGNNIYSSNLRFGTSTSANRWHHITWSISPSFWKIQINGSNSLLYSSAMMSVGVPMSNVLIPIPSAFTINTLFANIYLSTNLKGYIDDFRVYNRILNDDETYKLSNYRCLRTNYYTKEGNDLINVFDYNTGVSTGVDTGYKNEANEPIHNIFAPFSPAIISPQININAHLFAENVLHICDTISSDSNPVRAIDRIQLGQIVSSSVVSGKPYVLSIDRNNNTVVLNKSGGSAGNISGTGYSGYISANNGILNLLMDNIQQRSYGGNAPSVGDLVYHSLIPIGTYIKDIYEYGNLPPNTPVLQNSSFNIPTLSNNSQMFISPPYSAITNWSISASNVNIAIANNSVFWGFPPLPNGITQWLVVQSGGANSNATASYSFLLNSSGFYSVNFYTTVRQTDNTIINNTISASINGSTTGQLYVGNSAWSLQTLNFAGIEGINTVSFQFVFGDASASAIYLTGITLTQGLYTTAINIRPHVQYSLVLSNSSVNIPQYYGENVFWRKTNTTGFYTPTEFSDDSGYFLLSPDGRYEDYVYKLFSLGGSSTPFTAMGSYSVVDHANGYYTITYTDFGSIKFVNDVSSIQLLVVGSGGAGGRPLSIPSLGANVIVGGGGGEGGQVLYYPSYGIIPNNVYNIDIGMGGISGTSKGSNGSLSRFGYEVANGGSGGDVGTASQTTSGIVYVGGQGGSGITNGGNGGAGGNTSGQVGFAGILVSFGVNTPTYYGGGGAGGNSGTTNSTLITGGLGGGGNNGGNGNDGYGGGGGGGNGFNGAIGSGGKGVVMVYVGAPPDAPRALTPTTQTNNSIGFTFKPPNRIVLSYTVFATPRSGGATIFQSFTGTNYTITGLSPNTEYNIYITAQNSAGSSSSSTFIVSTLATVSPKPTFTITPIDNNSVDIYAYSPNTNHTYYSAYLTQYYAQSITTPTYNSPTNYIHIGNLAKNTWYLAYINGATTYGTMETSVAFLRTKNIAEDVSGIVVGSRTGETIQITFNRPSVDNGAASLFHYTFDTISINGNDVGNISSGVIVYDASLSGSSITTATSRYGNGSLSSSRFIGFPMKINNTYNFSLYSAISVCLWVNANRLYRGTLDSQPLWLFSFNNNTSVNNGIIYAVRFQSFGGLTLVCGNRTYPISISTPRNIWTHIAITQVINNTNNGTGTLNVYINGVLRFTNPNVNTYSDNMVASVNYLGSQNDGNAFYDGFIDDYRLYNVELTQSQITSILNNTISAIYPIDYYRIYSGDITNIPMTSNIFSYKIHPYLVKNGRIANLQYNPLIQTAYSVYDASLVNAPQSTLSNNYYELSLFANIKQCVQLRPFTIQTGGFSFACWFRSNSSDAGASIFYASRQTAFSATNDPINIYINGNDIMYTLNGNMTPRNIRSGGMNSNDIYFLVFVLSARSANTCSVSAYLNGASVYNESGVPYPEIVERSNVFLGRNVETNNYLNGSVFDICMWNRPLIYSEISSLYSNIGISFFQQNVNYENTPNITHSITGLSPRKVFTTIVSAVNADGESYSNAAILRTLNVPDSPSGFSVYGITDISASFTFIPPLQAVSYYLLSIKIYSMSTSSYINVVDLSFNDPPFTYGSFTKNTTYTAFLYAINNDGISPFASALFTTLKEPDPPSNIILTTIGNNFVSFTFSPSFGYQVLAYDLSAITLDVGETSVFVSFAYNPFITSYTLNGLKGGVNYTLYLTARNIFGNSPFATSSFQTTYIPNSPTNFAITSSDSNSLSFSFTPPIQKLTYYGITYYTRIPTHFRNIGFSPQTVVKTQPDNVICMALSSSSLPTRLAILGTNNGLRYFRILNGVWGTLATPVMNYNIYPSMTAITACAITPSASKIVVAHGLSRIYWGDCGGIYSGNGNSLYLIAIGDIFPRLCYGVAISPDEMRIVATEYNGYVYFSVWSGNNYQTLNRTYESVARKYGGVDITSNGEKIVYSGDDGVYWSYWNGSNYLAGTRISGSGNINGTRALNVGFVYRDEDILAITSLNGQPQYCMWNYTNGNYDVLLDISASALPITQGYGLVCDASGAIYLSPFSNTNIYSTTISYTKYSLIYDASLSPIATSGTITGLMKNTLYDMSLVAYNEYGGSPPVLSSGTTTNPPDTVSSIYSISSNISVDLSYCAPRQITNSYSIAVESSGILYSKSTASLFSRFVGLSPNTSYTASISASNSFGTSPSTLANFSTTGLPSVPNTPSLLAISSSSADFVFTLPEYDASSVYFNGNTQIISSSSAEFALNTGTVECWFKTSSISSGTTALVAKKGAYGLFITNSKLGVYNYVSNAWNNITSFNVNDDVWHHTALVFANGVNGGSALFYDGYQISSSFTYNVNNQSYAFSVGCLDGESASNFVGNICEVRIYNSVILASTIMMNYNKKMRQQLSGLVGYFPMSEGEGNAVKNAVKNGSVISLPISSATNVWTNSVVDIIDLSYVSFSINVSPVSGNETPIISSFTGRNVSVSGLLANKSYVVRLSSSNVFGNAPTSSAPFTITTRAITSPFPPTNFTVLSYTDVSLAYSFIRPADNPTTYKIYASPLFVNKSTVISSVSSSSNTISGILTGLIANVKYIVYATAFSGSTESPPSNTFIFIAPFPSPVITLNSFTDVSASITVSPSNYFAEYYIATFVDNGGGNNIVIPFSSPTSTLTGLTSATLYNLSVVAVAKGNTSLVSNSILFYTNGITTSPQNLSISSFGDTSATISFNAPQYGNATSYRVVATTNRTYVSLLTFTTFNTPITNQRSDNIGFAISRPANIRLALFATLANLSFSRIVNNVWGTYSTITVSGISSVIDYVGAAINYDGTRAVVIHGTLNSATLIYWGDTTSLLNGTNTNLTLTQTLETNSVNYVDVALTADGNRLVALVKQGFIYFATWNGSNYSAFTQTVNTAPIRDYQCICVSTDGERIAYCENTNVYWAVWNANTNNYIDEKYVNGTHSISSRSISFLGENKEVLVFAGANSTARYYIWNGNNYELYSSIISNTVIPALDNWGFAIDASNNIYTAPYSNTSVYVSSATVNYSPTQQVIQTFNAPATSYTITGLTSYRSYDISLSAVNSFGTSPFTTTNVVCGGTTGSLITNSAYTLYRFTQNGTITISGARTIYYVIVGGGGNGPNCSTVSWNVDSPGAGAGGVVSGVISQTVSTTYSVFVGRGGVAAGFSRTQNTGNPSRVYYDNNVLIANGGQSSESGANGGAAGTTTKGLSGIANVSETGAATSGSNRNVGFPSGSYSISIGATTYYLAGGGAGANSGTSGQTSTNGGGGGAATGVAPVSGVANTGGGGGGHIAFTSSTSIRNQTASGGSGVVLFFF